MLINMPHMRGDEPKGFLSDDIDKLICPTCVGMNLKMMSSLPLLKNMPHMRGDEPRSTYGGGQHEPYAPHAWG